MNSLIKAIVTGAVVCGSSLYTAPEYNVLSQRSDIKKHNRSKHPNILLIMTDQHNAGYLNCLGQSYLKTPNFDALARQSVIFRSAYSASPVCGPSRAALFTGEYPLQNGVYSNWVRIRKGSVLLTEQLKRNGYYNIMIGKLHLTPVDSTHGFDYRRICESPYDLYDKDEVRENDYLPWAAAGMGITVEKLVEKAGESEHSGVEDPFFWLGKSWTDDKYQMTTWTGNEAVSVIRDYKNEKPFFMHVSFFGPHHPYSTCEPWNSMYDREEVPLPPSFGLTQPGAQKGFHANWPESLWRELIASYSGNISAIDLQIGRIVAALKEKGLWENTLIVFTSDHGDHMGDYSQLGKGTMLESSVRVPFFIKPPGPLPEKRERPEVINLIDLYSTLLDYAGINEAALTDSRSIRGLLAGEAGWQNQTYSSFCDQDGRNGQVMCINNNYKCVGFLTDGKMNVELYDRNEKIADLHDLANDPVYEDVKDKMKNLLEEWLKNNLKNPSFDVLPGFINPPKGYGEVPFYWWQGDTLTRERILWQLDQLTNKGISSLQINYSHRDSGGLTYGLSNPSKPPLFSEAWWDLFKWFAAEAGKRGMSVSLSDYTIGVGQGFAMDEALKDLPALNGSLLNCSQYTLSGSVNRKIHENLLTLNAYKIRPDSSIIVESRKNLLPMVINGSLEWNTGKTAWKVFCVFSEKVIPSYDPMNPMSGKAYNNYFFDKFEKALPDKKSGSLNFFFSDELNFRLSGNLWNSIFAEEFRKRKGYDIVPLLDALFESSDPKAPKIKLDYNDVIVSLSEENFFEPVYKWHEDRGLVFGCDHGGRGRDLTEFGDYFRTQKWNQGPGSDQPRLSKDIIKAKVASSISHLYKRPRVWLEGFHSSGWGTSSADVTDAILANYVAGYNLLSFHGLYYSTMGGWWEWAPPDNHFRMPYWKQIDPLMGGIERLSYLLSQGYHNCDVAIIYPTEPVVTEMDGEKSVDIAFRTGELLYDRGIDFDFIDFESLGRSEVKNGELNVSDERYKVLIVPSMKAIRYASLKKIEEFRNAGGIIVNIGDTPEATEKSGMNDPETSDLVRRTFLNSRNMIHCNNPAEVPSAIEGKYEAGFRILSAVNERPYVMHRVIGKRDVFALYNLPRGSRCFFRSKGFAELWNPWTGKVQSLSDYAQQKDDGTEVTLPLTSSEIQIIVFDPDNSGENRVPKNKVIKEYDLGNIWGFELKPCLDNQWGDFKLPSGNEILGAEVRQLYIFENKEYSGEKLIFDDSGARTTCGFGPQFKKAGPLKAFPSEAEMQRLSSMGSTEDVSVSLTEYKWEDYSFSWQTGVEGDYGHQGYHGLKGEMYDNFIRLGAMADVRMSLKRVSEAEGNYYVLMTSVIAPGDGDYELLTGDIRPVTLYINGIKTDSGKKTVHLNKGTNPLMMIYDRACETYLILRDGSKPVPAHQPVSMRWYRDYGVLPFSYKGNQAQRGLLAFESAPGLQSITFSAYGKVSVWINGEKAESVAGRSDEDGLTEYSVLSKKQPTASQVALSIEYKPGFFQGGAIPEYIKQVCERGEISLGDWSVTDGLKSYSGGAWYGKSFKLEEEDLKNKTTIDLGDLVSSAELFVNGKSAGIRFAPPWTFDISELVARGENHVEVLVYNTLANNYIGIPTRFRGSIKSGLIGPVKLQSVSRE